MLDTSLCIKSSLVIDLSVVLSCKSVAIVSIWKKSLSTVCSVSATLFIRFIPPSSCFHKWKDFISVYKCYFPIVHAHSYFPCPNIHPPKKRNPDPIKEGSGVILWGEKMCPKWHNIGVAICRASTAGISLLCICGWVVILGTEQNMSGVWSHYQRVLIFCVVAPVFSLKLEGPKLASVRTE